MQAVWEQIRSRITPSASLLFIAASRSRLEESFQIIAMTDKLPHNLLALFAPRPPLRYLPHPDHAPEERHSSKISGVAAFLPALNEYKQQEFEHTESWFERRIRRKAEKKEALEKNLGEGFEACRSSPGRVVRPELIMLPHRQTLRRPTDPRRCLQDALCCSPKLRYARTGSGARVWALWTHREGE